MTRPSTCSSDTCPRTPPTTTYESVRNSGGYLHGAVVVSKDLDNNMSAEQTDHMVREGAGAGLIVAYPDRPLTKSNPP